MESLQKNIGLVGVLENKTQYGLCECCLEWYNTHLCRPAKDCVGKYNTFVAGEDVSLCSVCAAKHGGIKLERDALALDKNINVSLSPQDKLLKLISAFGTSISGAFYVNADGVHETYRTKHNVLVEIPGATTSTYFKESTLGGFTLQQKWAAAYDGKERSPVSRFYADKIARILLILARIHHAPKSPYNIWISSAGRHYSIELWSTMRRENIRIRRGAAVKDLK